MGLDCYLNWISEWCLHLFKRKIKSRRCLELSLHMLAVDLSKPYGLGDASSHLVKIWVDSQGEGRAAPQDWLLKNAQMWSLNKQWRKAFLMVYGFAVVISEKQGRVHVAFPLPLTFASLCCLGTGVKTRRRKGSPPGTSANLAEPCGGRKSRLPEVSLGTVRCTLPLCWGIYPQASWSRCPVRAGGACEADPGARPTRGLLHAPVLPSCGRQHLAFSVSLGSWGVDENNNWTLAFLYFHPTSSSCRVWRQRQ